MYKKIVMLFFLFFYIGCSIDDGYNFTGIVPSLEFTVNSSNDSLYYPDAFLYKNYMVYKMVKLGYENGDISKDSIVALEKYFDKWGRVTQVYDKENGLTYSYKYDGDNYITYKQIKDVSGKGEEVYYYYDIQHNLIQLKKYFLGFGNELDSLIINYEYEFSSLKKETRKEYGSWGTQTLVYEYDDQGNLIKYTNSDKIYYYFYEFKDDYFYKYRIYGNDTLLLSKYKLNNNNKVIEIERYNVNGIVSTKINFSYSGSKILIDSLKFNELGEIDREYKVEITTDGRVLSSEIYNSGKLFIREENKYDESARLIEKVIYAGSSMKIQEKREYTYDENGFLIEEKLFGEDNQLRMLYKYKYYKDNL